MTRDRGQVCLHEEKGFCGRTHPMEMLACFIIDRPGEKRVGSVLWKCHVRQKYAKNTEETGSTFMTLYFMNIISLILADAFLAIACAGRTRRVTVV